MAAIYKRHAAQQDLVRHYVYFYEQASPRIAEKFFSCAETTFNELASRPLVGSPLFTKSPRLAGLRKWRVKGFNNLIIFYFPAPDGIIVVRVLHVAQNWRRLISLKPS